MPRTSPGTLARRQRLQRAQQRRRGIVAAVLIVTALLVGVDLIRRGASIGAANPPARTQQTIAAPPTSAAPASPSPSAAPASSAPPAPVYALAGDYPRSGPGTWVYGTTQGPVLGTAGILRRFRVAIETGVPEDIAAFAAKVDETLGDARSWIAGRTFRLQRVPANATFEFTIYLATPETARRLCAGGGVDIRINGTPYTSCRTFGQVILNLARWRESTLEFVRARIPLEVYRQYLINHEAGHQFGYGHELCPGGGRPAPVMQTQTLGLRGCTANPWPYLDGRRYAGRSGQ